jgi:hypothetical protein
MFKMSTSLCGVLAVSAAVFLISSQAWADEEAGETDSAQAKTSLKLTGDYQDTTLIHHLGTSYGSGYANGRTVSVAVAHLEKVCRLPCKTTVHTEGEYYVDAPGMLPARLEIPAGARALKLQVKGAPTWPVYLSWSGVYLGGMAAALGGTFSLLRAKDSDYGFATPMLVGGLVALGAGIAGLILAPRTHLEPDEGHVERKSAMRLTAQGLQF